ncbi:MAG: pilus assembly protein PilM [Thermosulfidibacteraceae bacterium]|jgi:type IV pilus assembly protein PilM
MLSQKTVGIDFGSSAIKLATVKKINGDLEIENAFIVECSIGENFIRYLEDGKLERDLLNIWKVLSLKGSHVSVVLPSYLTIAAPINIPNYISEDKIEEVIREKITSSIPVSMDEVVFDYFIYSNNESGLRGIFTVARKKIVEELMKVIERLNSKIALVDSTTTAITNAIIFEEEKENFMAIDIGHNYTKIMVVKDLEIRVSRNISSINGSKITERISEILGISKEEAEKLKTSFSLENHLYEALAEETVSSLLSEIMALGIENTKVDKIYLTGGSSLLPGLTEKLSNITNNHVELFIPKKRIIPSKNIKNMLLEVTMPKIIAAIGTTIGAIV